jgi:hypothetical protein
MIKLDDEFAERLTVARMRLLDRKIVYKKYDRDDDGDIINNDLGKNLPMFVYVRTVDSKERSDTKTYESLEKDTKYFTACYEDANLLALKFVYLNEAYLACCLLLEYMENDSFLSFRGGGSSAIDLEKVKQNKKTLKSTRKHLYAWMSYPSLKSSSTATVKILRIKNANTEWSTDEKYLLADALSRHSEAYQTLVCNDRRSSIEHAYTDSAQLVLLIDEEREKYNVVPVSLSIKQKISLKYDDQFSSDSNYIKVREEFKEYYRTTRSKDRSENATTMSKKLKKTLSVVAVAKEATSAITTPRNKNKLTLEQGKQQQQQQRQLFHKTREIQHVIKNQDRDSDDVEDNNFSSSISRNKLKKSKSHRLSTKLKTLPFTSSSFKNHGDHALEPKDDHAPPTSPIYGKTTSLYLLEPKEPSPMLPLLDPQQTITELEYKSSESRRYSKTKSDHLKKKHSTSAPPYSARDIEKLRSITGAITPRTKGEPFIVKTMPDSDDFQNQTVSKKKTKKKIASLFHRDGK